MMIIFYNLLIIESKMFLNKMTFNYKIIMLKEIKFLINYTKDLIKFNTLNFKK